MEFIPKPQEIYRHFKGNLYQIITVAEHSETGEKLVIYQALYGEYKMYARPLAMFTEPVDKVKYPSADQEYRFELQSPYCDEKEQQEKVSNPQEKTGKLQESAESPQERTGESPENAKDSQLDPLLMEFLDADTYEQRLNILTALHHRITHEMLTTMAIVCDIEVSEGELEERYESLRSCLLTLERYECNRLR